jgi:hypothetical protein
VRVRSGPTILARAPPTRRRCRRVFDRLPGSRRRPRRSGLLRLHDGFPWRVGGGTGSEDVCAPRASSAAVSHECRKSPSAMLRLDRSLLLRSAGARSVESKLRSIAGVRHSSPCAGRRLAARVLRRRRSQTVRLPPQSTRAGASRLVARNRPIPRNGGSRSALHRSSIASRRCFRSSWSDAPGEGALVDPADIKEWGEADDVPARRSRDTNTVHLSRSWRPRVETSSARETDASGDFEPRQWRGVIATSPHSSFVSVSTMG